MKTSLVPSSWVDVPSGTTPPAGAPVLNALYLQKLEASILALSKLSQTVFNVVDYGAKGDGTFDDTQAFSDAWTALVAAGAGVFYMPAPPVNYRVTVLPTFQPKVATASLTYAVIGDGAGVTKIKHYGTTAASSLTVNNPGFDVNAASAGAPLWQGFTIDGANSSGGCSGLRWSDVSYGQFSDIEIKNFTTGDGMTFPNTYGWTEGIGMRGIRIANCANQIRFDVGSGVVLGTASASVASGTVVTSLAVSALTQGLYSGQQFVLSAAASAPGVAVQTFTTSASVAAGATTIPVTSTTLNFAVVSGTSQVNKGSYGSFDYWTVNSLYIAVQANQNGILSEAPRGLGGNIDRLGTTWRMTGNLFKGTTNTGALLRMKGRDNWGGSTNWDVSCEVDGSGVGHASVLQDTTASFFGGIGKFVAYYHGACTGAGYQYGISGMVALSGYHDTSGSNFGNYVPPRATPIKGGVRPNDTSGGLAQYRQTAPVSGTSYQNQSGCDVLATVTFTATAAGASAGVAVDNYSSMPAGPTQFGGIPSGMIFSITFLHYHNGWAKLTFANCTASAPDYHYG